MRVATTRLAVGVCLCAPVPVAAQWAGLVDVSAAGDVDRYSFEGAAGSNENYYDGDFGDYDGDFQIDRALISRYGLLRNDGGRFVPMSTQRDATRAPNTAESLTGYLFGDEVRIGNDAVQWVDLDGDGDLDVIQGGNGEPLVVQENRGGRFAVTQRLTGSAVQIVTTDLERDGDADLVVACWFASGPDDFTVLVNDGRGGLVDEASARGLALAGNEIIGVASGDVDRDGDFDLLVVSRLANALWVYRNDGAGRFARTEVAVSGRFRVTSGFSQGLSLGDIDDDGDLDAVMATDDYVGSSEVVGHLAFVNDGSGGFTEESAARFTVEAAIVGRLVGSNGKLFDIDYDGDLDFIAFTDLAGPPLNLQLFVNDGAGRFAYTRDGIPSFGGARASSVGADLDVADLDADGTYDLWVGIGGGRVTHLRNAHRDPDGRADRARALRVVSEDAEGVRLRWDPPPFAATARHYVVFRSLAGGREPRDRARLRTVAISPFEDEGFAAPITRFTRTDELRDPDVVIDAGSVELLDRTARPGVRYFYSVAHVGTENAVGWPGEEVVGARPATGEADTVPPELSIVSPTVQSWGASPRIVVTFADESGIDDGSLSITLDRDAGSLTAGTNLADRAVVRADGVAIIALGADDAIAVGAVELTARVSDRAGNEATASRTFAVTVEPRAAPTVDVTVDPASGEAPLTARFEASGVAGGDGAILSWDWVFGDGATATGRSVAHTFETAGSYDVRVRAVDDTGAVGEAVARVEVRPCVGECGPPDAGPAPAIDGAVPGRDAGADGGATPDDRVPARGGCAVAVSSSGSGALALALSLAAWARRRRRG